MSPAEFEPPAGQLGGTPIDSSGDHIDLSMPLPPPLYVSPGRPLLDHHRAACPVARDASPRAVAVVGVPGGVALVARPRGVGLVLVVLVVMIVFPRRGHDFLPVVVAVWLLPLWLGSEAHLVVSGV